MLTSVTLKFTQNDDLVLPANGITVFVGPNNSGKSLVLREIEQAFVVHPFPAGLRILRDYAVHWPTVEEVHTTLARFSSLHAENIPEGNVVVGRINPGGSLETTQIKKHAALSIAAEQTNKHWWATQVLRWGVVRLDGRSRFGLTDDRPAGDLLRAPNNVLAHLFQDDKARKRFVLLLKMLLACICSWIRPISDSCA